MSRISRARRRAAKPATVLFGAALTIGVACLPGQASAAATTNATVTAATHQITLDGVALQVSTPDYPTGALYTTPAGSQVQVASLSDNAPFRYLSVTAVPYGETLPESKYPESKSGNAGAWRKAGGGTSGPIATLFGQKVTGQIQHTLIPAGSTPAKAIKTVTWIVESGNRTWVVRLQHDEASLSAAFGGGLAIASPDVAAATSVNLKALAASEASGAVGTSSRAAGMTAATTTAAASTNLGRPSWWSSDCDAYTSVLNTKFMGLQVCGHPSSDRLESVPGVGQYEFECAELSDRYLVQRYGISGAGGNGNQVVDNFYNAYPSTFQRYVNGDPNPPVAGDVISFSVGGTGFGHTGVVIASNVDSSGNGTISMVHENWNENPNTPGEWDSIPVTGWRVEEVTGQGGTVAWLHNPADGAPPAPTPGAGAASTSMSDSNWSVYNPDTKLTTTFGVGTSGMIGFSTGNGTGWPNWAPVSGNWGTFPTTVKPTGIYNPDTKEMMVFARQADGTVGMSQYPDHGNAWFSTWTELNPYWKLAGEPSVVYNPDTRTMTVFARGNDGNLGFTQSVNGGPWSNWTIVNTYWGATFVGDPHAIYNPDTKQVSVFARSSAGDIGVSTTVPGAAWPWSNWAVANRFWKLGGDPSVAYNPTTKTMSLFARGTDGNLGVSSNVNGAGFSNWAIVNTYWGAGFTGTPHATYNSDTKQVSVFARDSAGDMGVSTYVPGGAWPWSKWAVVNPFWKLTGDPGASYNASTKTMTVFAMGSMNHLGVTASVNGGQFSNWNDANIYWNLAGPSAD